MIITFNGEERWVRITGKPYVENGNTVKVFGTIRDIHDEVMAENKVKEHQQLLSTLVDSLPLNVYVKDLESRKVLINKGESHYINKSKEEIIGKNDFDIYNEDTAKISREEDIQVMKHLTPIIGKETAITHNGKTTHFLTSKIPYFDLDGKVCGLIGMSLDISSIKKKEGELRDLIKITSMQNQKLIDFAHIVSHKPTIALRKLFHALGIFKVRKRPDRERTNHQNALASIRQFIGDLGKP